VDGIILATQYRDADELFEGISERLPVVTLSGLPRSSADTVALDSHEAGLLATRHLIGLGHERILHVCGPTNRSETVERERGYVDAMTEAGLAPLPRAQGTSWAADSGYRTGLAVDPAEFTAVFAANDAIALGFASAMRARGLTAPGDYSIVGVDDMPETAFYAPPLTTMRMDFDALGTVAFDAIRRRIETGERTDLRVLPSVLIERESTAPPKSDERNSESGDGGI
jgi:DNA-binding LacI/PurR family transcriptional regulator